jgi:hypothetical protein
MHASGGPAAAAAAAAAQPKQVHLKEAIIGTVMLLLAHTKKKYWLRRH